MSKVAVLQIDEIVPNEIALRGVDESSAEFQLLVDSIKNRGVLTAIRVHKAAGAEKYTLIDGLQRFTASRKAGLNTIPCNIAEGSLNEQDVLMEQLVANKARIETKPAEYAKQLQRILTGNPTLTISDLARSLSVSPEWLSGRLRLANNLTEEVQKMVDDGRMSASHGIAIARHIPLNEQDTWAATALSTPIDEFLDKVTQYKNELRKSAQTGGPVEFAPVAHLRKFKEIEAETASGDARDELLVNVKASNIAEAAEMGWRLALKWVMSSDPKSLADQKAAWDARQEEKKRKKEAAAAEREAKKAQVSSKVIRELALRREGKTEEEIAAALAAEFKD
jgi:ParB/RepB/Spo0J family partition protein